MAAARLSGPTIVFEFSGRKNGDLWNEVRAGASGSFYPECY